MGRRDRLVRQMLRERFVVTMTTGEAFDGVLIDADERTVVLASAASVGPNSRVVVDGQLYLPRASVAYMQRPEVTA